MQEGVRKPVNKGQLAVLTLLYQYRFITADRLARAERQKNVAVSRSRLTILYDQGYIGRHYDSSYKLQGKSASYYLLPRGLSALKATTALPSRAIKAAYNDKTASDSFIGTCLSIFDISMKYQAMHNSEVQLFTRSELAAYDYFPQPTPDLYVSIKDNRAGHYFVDYYAKDMQLFVMVRRIKRYLTYAESGAWDDTGSAFPCIVVICSSRRREDQLRARIAPLLSNSDAVVRLATTSIDEFLSTTSSSAEYRDITL